MNSATMYESEKELGFREFLRQVREEYEMSRSPEEERESEEVFTRTVRAKWVMMDAVVHTRFIKVAVNVRKRASTATVAQIHREEFELAMRQPGNNKRAKNDKSAADRKRYAGEMASFVSPSPATAPKPSKLSKPGPPSKAAKSAKAKPKTTEPRPKKALSAYHIFVKERHPTLNIDKQAMSKGAAFKQLSEDWKNLDAVTRREFEEKAIGDKKRYERDMALFRQDKFRIGGFGPDSDGEDPFKSDESLLASQ